MLIKNVYKQHARKHEALLRLGLPTLARTCAIAADYFGHAEFFPQESLLLLHSRTSDFSAGNFKATCYSMPGLMWQGLSRPFCNRNIGWWDFSLEQVGISQTCEVTYLLLAHESTSLDVNKANGMLTSNAKGVFCDSVTCFETNKCCSNRSHLPKCFIKAPHFLLAKVQLSNCFRISLFLHTPCSVPLSVCCTLLSINSAPASVHFSLEQVWISRTYQVT